MADPATASRFVGDRAPRPRYAPAPAAAGAPQTIDLLPAQLDLLIYVGDSLTLRFEFVDSAGAAVDMSGTWAAQIRQSAGYPTDPPLAAFTVDDSGAATGIILASLEGADTAVLPAGAALVWDLQQVTTGGAVRTTHRGTITLTQDVTRP